MSISASTYYEMDQTKTPATASGRRVIDRIWCAIITAAAREACAALIAHSDAAQPTRLWWRSSSDCIDDRQWTRVGRLPSVHALDNRLARETADRGRSRTNSIHRQGRRVA